MRWLNGPVLASDRRKALWAGFVRACERVERTAAMAGEDPSVAVLDWFGVSVKAAEMPAHLQRMKTLARKVPFPPFLGGLKSLALLVLAAVKCTALGAASPR